MSESQVAALSTPHLNGNEEFASVEHQTPVVRMEDAAEGDISFSAGNAVSVFDLAAEIESKLAKIGQKIKSHDDELNSAIDQVLDSLEALESKLQAPSSLETEPQ
ncbi:hypothetical protein PGUG_02886 [Meyerozyma guilliermondii ATCC 6260]|uniref:Uncharacterized protein n=1 Tax=Meyerozyma guilliermondii (strain ATCC 6260 / CBS 566 / DSM 6381 / JCM 1539 / NBRC 10279 / NRRL Y-324) TaxID=294746 RepID=A5DHY5_PICGU|nr:uncharacterized protein PGUG_02886 [Meyerozyma guilliermondii ATCC 6260]EDK38788.1 hypothetical protein PGUG_02886 [Meyerozyma guilliermondii ATCC 6260]